jgi:hypothetical protein
MSFPSYLLNSIPLVVSHVVMSYVVFFASTPSIVFYVEMSFMVLFQFV